MHLIFEELFQFNEIHASPFKRQTHEIVKHTQIFCRQEPTNCLSVFDHFAGLEVKELIYPLYHLQDLNPFHNPFL